MSLSSPSPSWFANTPYCSVREWTRFLPHRIKNIRIHPSTRYRIRCGYIFSHFGERIYFFSGFAVEFAGYVWTVAVSGTKKLRIQKYPDTCGRGLSRRLAPVQCQEYEYDLFEIKFFSPTKSRISKNVKTLFLFLFSFKLDGMKFESVFSDYDNNFS